MILRIHGPPLSASRNNSQEHLPSCLRVEPAVEAPFFQRDYAGRFQMHALRVCCTGCFGGWGEGDMCEDMSCRGATDSGFCFFSASVQDDALVILLSSKAMLCVSRYTPDADGDGVPDAIQNMEGQMLGRGVLLC